MTYWTQQDNILILIYSWINKSEQINKYVIVITNKEDLYNAQKEKICPDAEHQILKHPPSPKMLPLLCIHHK